MPTLMPTGDTPNDAPICGSDVEMIVPSRNCMKKAMATISATRWADAASGLSPRTGRLRGGHECSLCRCAPVARRP